MHALHYENEKLYIENVAVDSLISAYESPFYCYSSKAIAANITAYKALVVHNTVHIRFPVRMAPTVGLLRYLSTLNCGAECLSRHEIQLALAGGMPPEAIMLAGVSKSMQDIDYGLDHSIGVIVVESLQELETIEALAKKKRTKAPILLRLSLEVSSKALRKQNHKFDARLGIEWGQLREAMARIAASSHMQLKGISSHIGSEHLDTIPFQMACKRIITVINMFAQENIAVEWIDLGGALGQYNPTYGEPSFKHYCDIMDSALQYSTPLNVIMSPGNMLLSDAKVMVTRVTNTVRQQQQNFVVIDGHFSEGIIGDPLSPQAYALSESSGSARKERCTIITPLNEALLVSCKKQSLPRVKSQDYLVFDNICPTTSLVQVEGRQPFAEILIDGKKHHMLQKGATVDQAIRESAA